VAATGAAIGGKTVEAKCSAGTGSATSNADGSYSISVTSGSLPCVLKVAPASGPALYSVATGSGSSAVANISPVTATGDRQPDRHRPGRLLHRLRQHCRGRRQRRQDRDRRQRREGHAAGRRVDLSTIDVLAGTLVPATTTAAATPTTKRWMRSRPSSPAPAPRWLR